MILFSRILVEFKGNKGWEIGFEETPDSMKNRYNTRWGVNMSGAMLQQAVSDAAKKYLEDCVAEGYEARITYVPQNVREECVI